MVTPHSEASLVLIQTPDFRENDRKIYDQTLTYRELPIKINGSELDK
jgi:hypothetical protein